MKAMPSDWSLGYPRYMIEDGCPEIERGQIFQWPALEFYTEETLAICETRSRTAFEVDDYRYSISAEVIYLSGTASVIDFGLRAIRTRDLLPPDCREGDFVSGEIYVGFPLCTEVVPDKVHSSLKYSWDVVAIFADLTPFVEHRDDTGRSWFTRDRSQIRYEEIPATKALGAQAYVLRCRPRMQSHVRSAGGAVGARPQQ
jgi:hypothetical protein